VFSPSLGSVGRDHTSSDGHGSHNASEVAV